MRLFKRKTLIFLTLIGLAAGVYSVATVEDDVALEAVKSLQAKTDAVFLADIPQKIIAEQTVQVKKANAVIAKGLHSKKSSLKNSKKNAKKFRVPQVLSADLCQTSLGNDEGPAFAVKGADHFVPVESRAYRGLNHSLAKPISETLNFDKKYNPNDQSEAGLIGEFKKTKAILEEEFRKRQASKDGLDKGTLKKAATAAKAYLDLQKRLYINFFRNAHENGADERYENEISALNLHVASSTALSLFKNDKDYVAKFNLWHLDQKENGFEELEYGASPQDLVLMEQNSLMQAPSPERYKKLIQLMVIQERMTNQWAITRLLGRTFDNHQYAGCAADLYAFRGNQHQRYYQAAWAEDRSADFGGDSEVLTREELKKMSAKEKLLKLQKNKPALRDLVVKTTLRQPLFDEAGVEKLYLDFLGHWPALKIDPKDVNVIHSGNSDFDAEMNQNATYFSKLPEKTLEKVEKDYESADPKADLEVSRAVIAIIDSTLPADRFDPYSIGARVGWAAYHTRAKLLENILIGEIKMTIDQAIAKNPAVGKALMPPEDSENDYAGARKFAQELIANEMKMNAKTGGALVYRMKIQSAVIKALNSPEALGIVESNRSTRYADFIKQADSGINFYAQADSVDHEITKVIAQNADRLSDQGLLSHGGRDFELGFLSVNVYPKKKLLKERIRIFTPEMLNQFYRNKMEFWKEKNDVTAFAWRHAQEISRVANQIDNNPVVAAAVQKFFENLNAKYMDKLKDTKLTVQKLTPDNSPLAEVLPQVAMESWIAFYQSFNNVTASTGKTPSPLIINRFPDESKNSKVIRTYHQALSDLGLGGPYNAGARETEAIRLYLQAMSMMNLAGPLDPAYRPKAETSHDLIDHLHSPRDIEYALEKQAKQTNVLDQLTQSFLDQRLGAGVIMGTMLKQYPFLAVQPNLPNAEFTSEGGDPEEATAARSRLHGKLADRLIRAYTPGVGLDHTKLNTLIRTSLQSAMVSQRSLVEEACRAKPLQEDNEDFKALFLASKNLRAEAASQNPAFHSIDEKVRKDLRSAVDIFKENIDPIAGVLMWATMIAMVIYFGPAVVPVIQAMVAEGSWTSIVAAVKVFAEKEALVIAMKTFAGQLATKTVMSAAGGYLVGLIFAVQAVSWTYVNCYELPAQYQYQMNVGNSQIGYFGKSQITYDDLERFNAEIHSGQVSTFFMVGFQALMIPTVYRGVKNMLGITGRNALKRLATVSEDLDEAFAGTGGKSKTKSDAKTGGKTEEKTTGPVSQETVAKISQPGLKAQVKENGVVKGTINYLRQKFASLMAIGKFSALGAGASSNSIEILAIETNVKAFKAFPKSIKYILEFRNKFLAAKILRIGKIIDRALILNQGADESALEFYAEFSQMADGTGFKLREDTHFKLSDRMKNWIIQKTNWATERSLNIAAHPAYQAPLGIIVEEAEIEMAETRRLLNNLDSDAERTAFLQFCIIRETEAEMLSNLNISKTYDLYFPDNKVPTPDELRLFFNDLHGLPQEWAYWEKAIDHTLEHQDKTWANRILIKLGFKNETLPPEFIELKKDLKALNVLRDEWAGIKSYYLGAFGDAYRYERMHADFEQKMENQHEFIYPDRVIFHVDGTSEPVGPENQPKALLDPKSEYSLLLLDLRDVVQPVPFSRLMVDRGDGNLVRWRTTSKARARRKVVGHQFRRNAKAKTANPPEGHQSGSN